MKNTYKYSCKVEVNDEDTLKELYEYLRHHKYVVDSPYQSVGKYLANILVTVNDKRWLSYYLYYERYEGYAVLIRSDIENYHTNTINCGTDVDLFKKLVIIKYDEDDFDLGLYNVYKAYEK
mgnify:CR=1 FL=1|jgi:hypothetical protein